MPRWKQFIQGNNLHEEHLQRSTDPTPVVKVSNLSGKEVREEYEAIINEPSTSSVKAPTPTDHSKVSKGVKIKTRATQIQKTESKSKSTTIKPKPSNRILFSLCESNNIDDLSQYFETHGSDLVLNVNKIVDEYGWTLLMSAACAGSNAVVEYLLEIGASVNQKEKSGLTALDLATRKHKLNTCELIRNWVIVSEERQRNPNFGIEEEELKESDEQRTSKFCEACGTEIKSESVHNKCIAHLLSISSGVSDRVHYGLPESNRGFQLMLKNGWNRNTGLGVHGQGQKFPVKTVLKRDREGFGVGSSKEARITHFAPFDPAAVENPSRHKKETTINKELLEAREKRAKTKEANFRREFYSVD